MADQVMKLNWNGYVFYLKGELKPVSKYYTMSQYSIKWWYWSISIINRSTESCEISRSNSMEEKYLISLN